MTHTESYLLGAQQALKGVEQALVASHARSTTLLEAVRGQRIVDDTLVHIHQEQASIQNGLQPEETERALAIDINDVALLIIEGGNEHDSKQ